MTERDNNAVQGQFNYSSTSIKAWSNVFVLERLSQDCTAGTTKESKLDLQLGHQVNSLTNS